MATKKNYDTWYCKYNSVLYGSGAIDFDDGFCADPFFLSEQLIVFEFFDYEQQRGWIECYNIKSKERKKILDNGRHLSYPFVYLRDGITYLLPEENSLKRLCVRQIVGIDDRGFPVIEEAFVLNANIKAVDSMMFSLQGRDYVIYNCDIGIIGDPGGTLLLRQIEFGDDGLHAHSPQLISMDFRTTRNAGSFVKRDDGWMRIFQKKRAGVYGDGIGVSLLKCDANNRWNEEISGQIDNIPSDINCNSSHHVDLNHPEWGVVWDERK